MNNTLKDYTEYFRQLAVSHYLIQHQVAAESADATDKGNCKFAMFDTDEVVTGLRSAIGDGYVLFVEAYTFRGKDNDMGDYRSRHQGSFLLAKKTKKFSIADKVDNMAACEGIVLDIMNKIVYDSTNGGTSCGCPFQHVSLNDFSCEPVMEIWDGRSGWVVNFNFEQDRSDMIDSDRATDINIWVISPEEA